MLNQRKTTKDLIEKYNKSRPLERSLLPFIGDKKKVRIADIGSGPYSIIGNYLDGIEINIHHSDIQDFTNFWKEHNSSPFFRIEQKNVEKLDYPSEFFDIVVCINALDHTLDALKAVQELIRVCKVGGYVYIDCCLDQLDTGHKHYWNAKADGRLTNSMVTFDLKHLGFEVTFTDNGGESRYNHIIAILQKKHD